MAPLLRRSRVVLAVLALLSAAATQAPALRAYTLPVAVTASPSTRPLSDNFLGLALEYNSIPRWTGTAPNPVNQVLVQLIRNLDPTGRPVLRIGGQSTDRTWWPIAGTARPRGVTYNLTPAWTEALQALAQASQARLLLGLNLEANQPKIEQMEGAQLVQGIGRSYVQAFEIGNEPDLYTLVPWYRRLDGRVLPWYSHDGTPVYARGSQYGPSEFAAEFERVLKVVPPLPIAGPETGTPTWLQAFRRFLFPRSQVRMLTSHAYGLNQCVTEPRLPAYPSVPHLLSLYASRQTTGNISPYVALAHRNGASYRIDEMGSISCNGRAGVSNTMASALWILDTLFSIADQDIDGVNIHTYPASVNGPFDFVLSGGQWEGVVHPLYYGALMFAKAAPAGSRLLTIHAGRAGQLRAWATLGPDRRVRVLLINDSLTHQAQIPVLAPLGWRPPTASVDRLLASSAYATTGVTLGGQSFGAMTTTGILPAPVLQTVASRRGTYEVSLPPGSAALLTLPPSTAHAPRQPVR